MQLNDFIVTDLKQMIPSSLYSTIRFPASKNGSSCPVTKSYNINLHIQSQSLNSTVKKPSWSYSNKHSSFIGYTSTYSSLSTLIYSRRTGNTILAATYSNYH